LEQPKKYQTQNHLMCDLFWSTLTGRSASTEIVKYEHDLEVMNRYLLITTKNQPLDEKYLQNYLANIDESVEPTMLRQIISLLLKKSG